MKVLVRGERDNLTGIQSQSYITTDGQSASLSWCQAPIWDQRPIFFYRNTKSKLYYDRQSVGQSVLVSGTHLGPASNFFFLLSLIIFLRQFRACWRGTPSLTRSLVRSFEFQFVHFFLNVRWNLADSEFAIIRTTRCFFRYDLDYRIAATKNVIILIFSNLGECLLPISLN
jgi:hypothetical protein